MTSFSFLNIRSSGHCVAVNSASFSLILAFFLFFSLEPLAFCLEDRADPDFHKSPANKEILEGIHLLYDQLFEEAESIFLKVIAESPKKPEGYFYMAMVSWSRLAAGFWSPETVNQFRRRIDRAVHVAKSRIGNSHKPDYDYFFLRRGTGLQRPI